MFELLFVHFPVVLLVVGLTLAIISIGGHINAWVGGDCTITEDSNH